MSKKAEVIYVLASIEDECAMKRFVSHMDRETIDELFTYLNYTDDKTVNAWYAVYARLMKGG